MRLFLMFNFTEDRRSTRIDPPGLAKGWEPGPHARPGGKDEEEEDEDKYKYVKNGTG